MEASGEVAFEAPQGSFRRLSFGLFAREVLAGGRVVADWPGLSARALYQQRDLKPTLDLRSVMKSVLHDHLQIASRALDHDVFPDSPGAPYIAGLLRGHEA